ncbi:MAG: UDP-4-amino-4,6-dideoxy-N-acetyl-beta-L-altrosamine transaminase [Thermodesulfobacteriota bacterium]
MERKAIPYARQWVDADDLEAVAAVLSSDWLTTGPRVADFESAVAAYVGAREGVAVNSGTAALHAAMFAAGLGPGDEVIVPPLTFVATANAVVFQGATPVFADIDPETLLLDPEKARAKITPRTKAVVAVDYAGHPCDYEALRLLARQYDLVLIADACHSLGATYRDKPLGSWADLTVFSFHPAKHITTGEGGMVVTSHKELAAKMRLFRNHGISTDFRERAARNTWHYEMVDLGYNYRLSDLNCALGLSQLQKMPQWLQKRRDIARQYDAAFLEIPEISLPRRNPRVSHAYHLYVIMLHLDRLTAGRREIFQSLRAAGLGVNVHYLPVHLHPFYQQHFHTGPGDCPAAEWCYERLLTLPLFPAMSTPEVERVIQAVSNTLEHYRQENGVLPGLVRGLTA